jgi:hypothetical protein
VFSKNDQLEITVMQKDGASTIEYNYVDMIKKLIDVKSLEEPEMIGDFSDSEKDSIMSMIGHINAEVSEFYSEGEE